MTSADDPEVGLLLFLMGGAFVSGVLVTAILWLLVSFVTVPR